MELRPSPNSEASRRLIQRRGEDVKSPPLYRSILGGFVMLTELIVRKPATAPLMVRLA
jgi:hypothetical protein